MSLRPALLACLLFSAASASAQDALPPPSGQWQADAKQNAKLFKLAESDFRTAMKARRQQMTNDGDADAGDSAAGGFGGGRHGGMGGGGMHGGGMHGGGRRGGGRGGSQGLVGLLPGELAFAAPADGTLIVQRMHDAVAFAQDGDGAVTMIPLSSDGANLGNGVKASARDDAGNLVLDATTPNGLKVEYRYQVPRDKPDTLAVHITVNGHLVDGLKLERVYAQAKAK